MNVTDMTTSTNEPLTAVLFRNLRYTGDGVVDIPANTLFFKELSVRRMRVEAKKAPPHCDRVIFSHPVKKIQEAKKSTNPSRPVPFDKKYCIGTCNVNKRTQRYMFFKRVALRDSLDASNISVVSKSYYFNA